MTTDVKTKAPHFFRIIASSMLIMLGSCCFFSSSERDGRLIGGVLFLTGLLLVATGCRQKKTYPKVTDASPGSPKYIRFFRKKPPPVIRIETPRATTNPESAKEKRRTFWGFDRWSEPTPDQCSFARRLGISITPEMGKWEVSDLITEATKKTPRR